MDIKGKFKPPTPFDIKANSMLAYRHGNKEHSKEKVGKAVKRTLDKGNRYVDISSFGVIVVVSAIDTQRLG